MDGKFKFGNWNTTDHLGYLLTDGKMSEKRCEGMEWTELNWLSGVQMWALVNKVMNLLVL
jgi:hypothetical protein